MKLVLPAALFVLLAGCASSPPNLPAGKSSNAKQGAEEGCPCTVEAKPDGTGRHEVRIVTAGATKSYQLIRSPSPIDQPTLSKDFSLIAYRVQREGVFDVQVQEVSTGMFVVVTTKATNAFTFHFSDAGLVLVDSAGEALLASTFSLKQELYQRELRLRKSKS